MLIEASEESGSPDLPAHVEALADRIGSPELVVCLDSGCLDDERLWVTTSLRGLAEGDADGRGPHRRRALRRRQRHRAVQLPHHPPAARPRSRTARPVACCSPSCTSTSPPTAPRVPPTTAAAMPRPPAAEFPFAGSTRPMTDDPTEQLLAKTWRPTLSVIGADGLPPTSRAGNVLRPSTTLALSFRLPPTCDHVAALDGRRRTVLGRSALAARPSASSTTQSAPGWNAPPFAPWLREALDEASTAAFGQPARTFGEGGTIPFMGMLGERFPDAQFVVTGVLAPGSNAHGPNEFLHLPMARRVTECIARLLGAHAASPCSERRRRRQLGPPAAMAARPRAHGRGGPVDAQPLRHPEPRPRRRCGRRGPTSSPRPPTSSTAPREGDRRRPARRVSSLPMPAPTWPLLPHRRRWPGRDR